MFRLKERLRNCRRVLKITKKPDKPELKKVVKITGLGIIVIGSIGLLIQMFFLFTLLYSYLK